MYEKVIELNSILVEIEANYTNYDIRYILILKALILAKQLGYKSGFRFDATEPLWPVIAIMLPVGEISWHMPPCDLVFDKEDNVTHSKKTRLFNDWIKKKYINADDKEFNRSFNKEYSFENGNAPWGKTEDSKRIGLEAPLFPIFKWEDSSDSSHDESIENNK
jgi:hypothetical protein